MNDDSQMKIRLPVALKDQIEAAAKAANRSLNGEIVSRLEASLGDALSSSASSSLTRRGPRSDSLSKEVEDLRMQVRMLATTVTRLEKKVEVRCP